MIELSFHFKNGWKKHLCAFCLMLCVIFSMITIPVLASTGQIQNPATSTSVKGSSYVNGSSTVNGSSSVNGSSPVNGSPSGDSSSSGNSSSSTVSADTTDTTTKITNPVENLAAASASSNSCSCVKVGKTFSKNKLKYKVTGSSTVAFTGTSSTAKKIIVPTTVTLKGVKYKVTSIAANAFKNNTKVKTIVIGTNVKKIGSNAFAGCTKLTTIQIKSTKIKASGLNAKTFKGISNKVAVKVPKKKLKAYKKIFKQIGVNAKIKSY
jgi:hypothetical protein